jgi:RimJ/RimL family protein N-acetyltransferase
VALRAWARDDVPALVRACADPLVARYTSVPVPYTPEDAVKYVEAGRSPTALPMAAVSRQDPDEVLGAVGLHAVSRARRRGEIGYWTASWARGRGVATEALSLLSLWAMENLGLGRLDLYAEPENEASHAVALRAGFERGELVRSGIALRGRRYDVIRFTLAS